MFDVTTDGSLPTFQVLAPLVFDASLCVATKLFDGAAASELTKVRGALASSGITVKVSTKNVGRIRVSARKADEALSVAELTFVTEVVKAARSLRSTWVSRIKKTLEDYVQGDLTSASATGAGGGGRPRRAAARRGPPAPPFSKRSCRRRLARRCSTPSTKSPT